MAKTRKPKPRKPPRVKQPSRAKAPRDRNRKRNQTAANRKKTPNRDVDILLQYTVTTRDRRAPKTKKNDPTVTPPESVALPPRTEEQADEARPEDTPPAAEPRVQKHEDEMQLSEIVQSIQNLDGLTLVFGVDGDRYAESGMSYAAIAAGFEFGFPNHPSGPIAPRPFLSTVLLRNERKYAEALMAAVLEDLGSAPSVMEDLSRTAKADVQTFLMDPGNGLNRNTESTIETKQRRLEKGERSLPSNLPGVDTGGLMDAVFATWYSDKVPLNIAKTAFKVERDWDAVARKGERS